MFNMGFGELLLLGAIALIFIGPKQLPEVARTVARLLNELKRATGDLGTTIMDVKNQADRVARDAEESFRRNLIEEQKKQVSIAEPEKPESSEPPAIVETEKDKV